MTRSSLLTNRRDLERPVRGDPYGCSGSSSALHDSSFSTVPRDLSRFGRGPALQAEGRTASAKATASLADQPPLKLRRSAGALAKAEALRAKAEATRQVARGKYNGRNNEIVAALYVVVDALSVVLYWYLLLVNTSS